MKIKCRVYKDNGRYYSRPGVIQWTKAAPFLVNPRGVLIHRVRSVISFSRDGRYSHESATYWCSNHGRGQFYHDPPKDRLLCAVCEARAVARGEPTAEQLAGRHVCIGRMRAERLCCKAENN